MRQTNTCPHCGSSTYTDIDLLEAVIDKIQIVDGHWKWTGGGWHKRGTKRFHPSITHGNHTFSVARLLFDKFFQKVGKKVVVKLCDVTDCVLPDHHTTMTRQQYARYMNSCNWQKRK